MIYVVSYFEVQPSSASGGLTLLRQYRQAATAKTGNSRTVLLQESSRRNRFVVIEIWTDQPAFEAHEASPDTGQVRSALKTIYNAPYDQRLHTAFAVGPEASNKTDGIFAVTHVDVPPPRREETEVLLRELVQQSRNKPGNLQFDVFQQNPPRTNHFTVSAAWADEAAFVSFQTAEQTRQFRERLGPMLGAPYDERLFSPAG
jgi:quinol monooxygenase YgiN